MHRKFPMIMELQLGRNTSGEPCCHRQCGDPEPAARIRMEFWTSGSAAKSEA